MDKNILFFAANAFDGFGNTMLGVACEYGYSVEAVQKLIDMGALLDTPDQKGKLALHWAMANKKSHDERRESVDVVNCLLENGARTETHYDKKTLYGYAISRGFHVAAQLIKAHEKSLKEGKLCKDRLFSQPASSSLKKLDSEIENSESLSLR
ncbi:MULTISPECIES: ankyrin repeat domain-containing protein [unclassified Legionella]|uniref:ankyrin repeat domain-containing protein n=1 Tax=unclassified Legionella TaxID=2622702 RepID=UPI0010541F5C|nr:MULTISPECIES: ankyrin repeat domain-containing protein [unclassified Legionella]MDI9819733.1 ankyrin repeat domain-containing protein [Legionella sp. PL877]